ncbi:MAG: hypothetical protein HRF42_05380 [Candidatus Brocadia sp.]|jgi:hypothetical protein
MKHVIFLCIAFLLIPGLEFLNLQSLFAQEPVLESYSMAHGGDQETTPWGVKANLFDKFFGGGTAKARITFNAKDNSSHLSLKVWRKVRSGEIAFALLVFRTEVRCYDASGGLVYSRDLEGFTFGDSSSGQWSQKLHDLPANIQQIRTTFIGNYE